MRLLLLVLSVFGLTGLVYRRPHQVRPGPRRSSREPVGIAARRRFTFLSLNQQCRCTEGIFLFICI